MATHRDLDRDGPAPVVRVAGVPAEALDAQRLTEARRHVGRLVELRARVSTEGADEFYRSWPHKELPAFRIYPGPDHEEIGHGADQLG